MCIEGKDSRSPLSVQNITYRISSRNRDQDTLQATAKYKHIPSRRRRCLEHSRLWQHGYGRAAGVVTVRNKWGTATCHARRTRRRFPTSRADASRRVASSAFDSGVNDATSKGHIEHSPMIDAEKSKAHSEVSEEEKAKSYHRYPCIMS